MYVYQESHYSEKTLLKNHEINPKIAQAYYTADSLCKI